MKKRKFSVGDIITNNIVTKEIIALKKDHYLTDCGRVDYENESKWQLYDPDNNYR